MSKNLWPNFDSSNQPRSPKAVVEEAGRGLAEKTKRLVQFTQNTNTAIKDDRVDIGYALFSPILLYKYPFMRINFGIEKMYPTKIFADKVGDFVAGNEDELIAALAKIFNASSTIETIQRLMTLAKE